MNLRHKNLTKIKTLDSVYKLLNPSPSIDFR